MLRFRQGANKDTAEGNCAAKVLFVYIYFFCNFALIVHPGLFMDVLLYADES